MKKIIKKIAKAYAKSTTNTCIGWFFHAPVAPRTLIKK